MTQLQQQQQLDQQALIQSTAREKQEILAQAERAEEERRRGLKRAVAKQRAQFGGSGISSGDGSSEAVLLGLFEETEEDKAASDRLDKLRLQALDQKVSDASKLNTLKRTQLAERERLNRTSSTISDVADLFKIF